MDSSGNSDLDTFMKLALDEADAALLHGDVPVAALCVLNGEVVAIRHNEKEASADASAHAEMLVLREAAQKLGVTYLTGATLFATLEPCAMCTGAMVLYRIQRIVFGAYDTKAGACGSLYNLCADPRLNHEIDVVGGVMADSSSEMLKSFFRRLRS